MELEVFVLLDLSYSELMQNFWVTAVLCTMCSQIGLYAQDMIAGLDNFKMRLFRSWDMIFSGCSS